MELIDRPTSLISGRNKTSFSYEYIFFLDMKLRPRPLSRIGCRDYFSWDIWCENYTPLTFLSWIILATSGWNWTWGKFGNNSRRCDTPGFEFIMGKDKVSSQMKSLISFLRKKKRRKNLLSASFSFFSDGFHHIFPREIAHITPELITR